MLEKNPKTVKVVFKNFPLGMHKFAFPAALAAMAAHEQGKFWEFHDRLFENHRNLDIQTIEKIAQEVGLDMDRFKKDMTSPAIRQKVIEDMKDGQEAGVRGTPTIFVEGRRLQERSPQAMQAVIDEELAAAK